MPIVKLLSENPEPRWATHAIVFQGKKLLFRSRTEAETAAVTLRKKGIGVQVMAIRERAKNPNKTRGHNSRGSRKEQIESKLAQAKATTGKDYPIWIVEISKDNKHWQFVRASLGEAQAKLTAANMAEYDSSLYIRARQVMAS